MCFTPLIKSKVLSALQQARTLCRLGLGVDMNSRPRTGLLSDEIELLLIKYEHLNRFLARINAME